MCLRNLGMWETSSCSSFYESTRVSADGNGSLAGFTNGNVLIIVKQSKHLNELQSSPGCAA